MLCGRRNVWQANQLAAIRFLWLYGGDVSMDLGDREQLLVDQADGDDHRLEFRYEVDPDSFTVTGKLCDLEETRSLEDRGQRADADIRPQERSIVADTTIFDHVSHEGELPDEADEVMTVETPALRYRRDDVRGYLLNPEEPLLITIGGHKLPFGSEEDWGDDDLATVLDEFNSALYDGVLLKERDEIRDEIDRRSKRFVEDYLMEHYDQGGPHSFYRTLEDLEQIEEAVPGELQALRDFIEDNDFSMDTDDDRIKLEYLWGGGGREISDGYMQKLADDLARASRQDEEINIRRLKGLETFIGDINRVYREWKKEWSESGFYSPAERVVKEHDLSYSVDAIEQFAEEEDLANNAGYFLSALINNINADRVELPDMKNVDGIGVYNAGTEIIIDGDAGGALGKKMRSGRIEVDGSLKRERSLGDGESWYDTGWAGKDMSGGEIYIKGSYKLYSSAEGDVYEWNSPLFGEEGWKKVEE